MTQEEKIQYYAHSTAKELCDVVHFSIEDVAILLRSRFRILLHDVLNDEISILEKKRALIIEEISMKIPGWKLIKLRAEIGKLNVELKKLRIAITERQDKTDLELLKKLCKDELGNDFIQKFYKLKTENGLR